MIDRFANAEFENPGVLRRDGENLGRALKMLSYCGLNVTSVRFRTRSDVEWAKRALAERGDGVVRDTFEGIPLDREPCPES